MICWEFFTVKFGKPSILNQIVNRKKKDYCYFLLSFSGLKLRLAFRQFIVICESFVFIGECHAIYYNLVRVCLVYVFDRISYNDTSKTCSTQVRARGYLIFCLDNS